MRIRLIGRLVRELVQIGYDHSHLKNEVSYSNRSCACVMIIAYKQAMVLNRRMFLYEE